MRRKFTTVWWIFFDSLSIVVGDLSLRLGMFGEENQVVSYE